MSASQGIRVDNLDKLQKMVASNNGRLVAYTMVVSCIFISARNYHIKWVSSEKYSVSSGFPATIVSILLGWWSPYGPYWTLSGIIWNFRGGVDITNSLMKASPGCPVVLDYSDQSALNDFQTRANKPALIILCSSLIILVGLITLWLIQFPSNTT